MAEKKETAVAVVADRTRLSALVGSIDERIKAFDQIAANLAQIQLNGWDDVQKLKAACWLADGAGMHPAIFVQNHYCMRVQSRLLVEPKWEFIVGVLQSRIPGFRWKVNIETDDCAEVWMTDGKSEHTVQYTLGDAKRQGLLGRGGNAWTTGNTREMCLKQAIKRCGRRVGSAALMDLPVGLESYETVDGAAPAPSAAEVIDKAIAKASGEIVVDVVEEEPAGEPQATKPDPGEPPPVTEETVRERLKAVLTRFYGVLSKDVLGEKVNLIYNAMMLEQTGTDPKVTFTKKNQIGPVEAEQVIAYLTARMEKPAKEAAPSDNDAPPAAERVEAPTPSARTAADAYDDLMVTVSRARRLFAPRQFIQEAPPGSGKYWLVDQATFAQVGDTVSVKLQSGPDIVCPMEKIEALNKILSAACDDKERIR